MEDESKVPYDNIAKALDIMMAAGWVRGHARNLKTGMAIDYTERGAEALNELWSLYSELRSVDDMNRDIWWAVAFLGDLKFGQPPE